jgi:predicted nucleic acid-binding protein
MFVWWGSEIECAAAIARFEREKVLTSGGVAQAIERLSEMRESWSEVPAHGTVRRIARRIVRVHPLRAADALQLAAAVVASENQPETLELVSLDARLTQAALREGFSVTEIA